MERTKSTKGLILKLALGIVLAITLITHLVAIKQTYIFQNDEARDALIALKMIQNKKPVLLGPETSVGNMYLGPFYYYLMAPALMLANLDPVGPAVMAAFFGIATTFLIYLLGKRWHSPTVGVIAALFYALSPIMVHHSRSSWNPNVIPFFVSLLLLLPDLTKPLLQLCFGLLVGILFQLHYVALILPGLLFIWQAYVFVKAKEYHPLVRFIGLALVGFLVTSAPFWLFEFRHNFVNSSAFITYLSEKTSSTTVYPPYLNRFFANFRLLINGALFSSSLTATIPSFITWVGGIFFVLTLLLRTSPSTLLLALSILLLSFLKENMNIHYLAFLFPLTAVWFGSLFTLSKILRTFAAALCLYMLFHFYPSFAYALTRTENVPVIRSRQTAAYIVKEAAGRPYNVVGSQGTFTNTISYFLAISNNPPQNDLQPLLFDICTGGPCKADEETTVLLYLTGPSHPSLIDYLGHPAINEFTIPRKIVKNEWVTYDIFVATIELEP